MTDTKTKINPLTFTLGDGPFRYVGLVQIKISPNGGFAVIGPKEGVKGGIGTCAHCSTAILDSYIVENAAGERYGIGSSCILKASLPAPVVTQAMRDKRDLDRKKRQDLEARNVAKFSAQLETLLASHSETLKTFPHPSQYFAAQNKTLLDYITFCKRGASSMSLKALISQIEAKIV